MEGEEKWISERNLLCFLHSGVKRLSCHTQSSVWKLFFNHLLEMEAQKAGPFPSPPPRVSFAHQLSLISFVPDRTTRKKQGF